MNKMHRQRNANENGSTLIIGILLGLVIIGIGAYVYLRAQNEMAVDTTDVSLMPSQTQPRIFSVDESRLPAPWQVVYDESELFVATLGQGLGAEDGAPNCSIQASMSETFKPASDADVVDSAYKAYTALVDVNKGYQSQRLDDKLLQVQINEVITEVPAFTVRTYLDGEATSDIYLINSHILVGSEYAEVSASCSRESDLPLAQAVTSAIKVKK